MKIITKVGSLGGTSRMSDSSSTSPPPGELLPSTRLYELAPPELIVLSLRQRQSNVVHLRLQIDTFGSDGPHLVPGTRITG